MPDYNPDREGHVGHKFIVQKAWPGTSMDPGDSVQTSKGALKFDEQDRLAVKDPALAREIQQANPRELAVTRVRQTHHSDTGHRYHFGQMPAMPWHRYDENGNRIKEQEEQETWQSQSDQDRKP